MPDRSPSHRPRGLETLFESIVTEDSLERTLRTGLAAFADAAGAHLATIAVFEEGRTVHECWYPEDQAPAPDIAEAVGRAARQALMPGGGGAASSGAPEGLVVLPLSAHERTFGAICYVPAVGTAPRGDQLRRVVRALARRVGADLEIARGHALQARYERWFKTLDEQLRVLDRERQKFAAIVHASDAAVFVTDLSGRIRWTNSVMADRAPAGASAWVGLSCRDVCREFANHGDSPECDDCPVTRVLRENTVVHREFHRANGGAARSLYLTALPIKAPDGRPEEAMVMLQDLSDLEILRSSESRYRLLFERSGRGIVMVDPTSREIVLANASASWLTGYERDQLLRLRLPGLHSELEWRRLEPHYAEALASGDLGPRECHIRTRDGVERLATVAGARTDLDGRQVLMLEFRDITETRRVEEALHFAEERLRRVVAGSPIVLFALDRDGVFTLSEGRSLAALGLEPGQVVGQSVWELYKDAPAILDHVRRALAGEEFAVVVDVGPLAFETSYAPLKGADGSIQGVIGVATDVTDRRRLEEQLRQAQRMEAIGRLAGGVAHDFNNLLAAILGHSELMLSRVEAGHPLRRSAEEVQKAAVRGAMLTRQLLAFGRKDMLSFQVLDLNAVLAGMEGMLRRLIGEDIELETQLAPRVGAVRADRGQLEQVILNLAVNARDAMPRGGRLTLEVAHVTLDEAWAQRHAGARSGHHVVLSVTDTGIGMDAETIAHVFEPFYTTKERGKGTGLGLATVYGVVEQSGGQILVQSEPGVGSRFQVYLPAADELEIRLDDAAPAEPPRGGHETVLVAEDEDGVRAMAREVLEANGFAVLDARNGVEALRIAGAHAGAIDLLVTDVVMPQMGGGELAQRLTAERPGLRVLYISGYADDAIVRHGVLERGAALLQKPFTLADFARKVREVLDAPARLAA